MPSLNSEQGAALLAKLSELGLGFYMKRALLALPFVLAALPLLLTLPGTPLLHLQPQQLHPAAKLVWPCLPQPS